MKYEYDVLGISFLIASVNLCSRFCFFPLFHGMSVDNIVSGKAGLITLEQALDQAKKIISLVSGNRPGETFFITHPPT